MQRANSGRLSHCLFFLLIISSAYSSAAEKITDIFTVTGQGSPLEFSVDNQTYQWGFGAELLLNGFNVDGRSFEVGVTADRVTLVREDIPGVASGEPCGIYAERVNHAPLQLSTGYPGDGSGSGNCDMASVLESRVINRGTLDIFANTLPAAKNIERVDVVFRHGLLAPLSDDALLLAGFMVGEKRGNNPLQVAAITALDEQGNPASYGDLTRINPAGCGETELCYSVSDIAQQYAFFQSNSLAPQGFAKHLENSSESIAAAFVSARTLGLSAGQLFYGMSVFPEDVNASTHSLLDPSTFPQDTQDEQIEPGDGADITGGVTTWFLAQAMSQVRGRAFVDLNANGLPDAGEDGIAAITLSLVADEDTTGTASTSVATNQEGISLFTGLAPGSYSLELDTKDADIPAGMTLASANPLTFSVVDNETQLLYFAFTPEAGTPSEPVANADVFTINLPPESEITTPTTSLDVLANDVDPLGQGLTIVSVSGSNNATIVIEENQVSYTPKPGFRGNDTFTYTMADANAVTNSGVVSVVVTNSTASDAPMANDDSFTITVELGSAIYATTLDVLGNDTDPFAAGLSIVNTPESANGIIVVNPDNTLGYTPTSDSGSDVFNYTLQDGRGMESTASVTVNVNLLGPVAQSEPVIQTEVHGTGLAATVPTSILVLVLTLMLRLTLCHKNIVQRRAR